MAVIRATCEQCGDQELTVDEVRVRVCEQDGTASYLFRCHGCRLATCRNLDGRTVDLLVGAGATVEVWRLPAELSEPRPLAPDINEDDLIDAHRLLSDDELLESVMERMAVECDLGKGHSR